MDEAQSGSGEEPNPSDAHHNRLKAGLILYSPFLLALALARRVSWMALLVGFLAGVFGVTVEAVMIWQQFARWTSDRALSFRPSIRLSIVVFASLGIILLSTTGPLIGFGLVTTYLLWSWKPRQLWIAQRARK